MIIGIGSDLIDIRRVAKVIERHGDRFLDRVFTEAERAKAGRRAKNQNMVVATYAKRFAAKEACSKALGTGIRGGVWWRDMGVVNLPGGRPTMQLTGGALARLEVSVRALNGRMRTHARIELDTQKLVNERARLAAELDKTSARAKRLDDSAHEVSRRLVDAMETVRQVLAR